MDIKPHFAMKGAFLQILVKTELTMMSLIKAAKAENIQRG